MQFVCWKKKAENLEDMSSCLKAGFSVYGTNGDIVVKNRVPFKVCSSIETLQFKDATASRDCFSRTLEVLDPKHVNNFNFKAPVNVQPSFCIAKSLRWWEKSLQPNMVEIQSAQQLVYSLSNAGDSLVVLDFYSPGCGGCKTLHPKICQMAEMNPNAIFLKVNYEQHKEMCYALNVHVLPFFRLYRGEEGRVCSFSCTNATIKKFKDALSKHGTDRCGLGPAKGLDESELVALASIGLISRDLLPNSNKMEILVLDGAAMYGGLSTDENVMGLKEDNAMVMA